MTELSPNEEASLSRRQRVSAASRSLMPQGTSGPSSALTAVYALLGCFVVLYVVSIVVRLGEPNSIAFDGWAVDGFELAASALCISRALLRRPGRGVALALGFGLATWSTGDTIVTISGAGATPLLADACYLSFYPLAYAAVIMLMRREMPRISAPSWLDGGVAGLGAAAVCASFAFHDIVRTTGGTAFPTAMNLAYPVGDLLLVALVVGGTAILSGRKPVAWLLVASACSLNAVGDTFNLLHGSVGSSPVGQGFNATAWPVAILFLSLAVWVRSDPKPRSELDSPAGFLLPGLAAASGLAILIVASVHPIGRVALDLATATLGIVGIRLTLSIGMLRSLTQQRQRQSMTDELTGLGNRRYLTHVFETLFLAEERIDNPLALLFVDLDRFKEVNDSFGHAAGDELLRQIGPRLASSLRRSDVLIRLGGDEFSIVLPETDAEQAVTVAERLAASLIEPFFLDSLPIQISASIGISVAPEDASNLADLLGCADAAMYRAKLSRTAFQVYDHALDNGGDLLHLVEELRVAIDEGTLTLHFQPQLDLRTGSISAMEALLRWEHPRLGTIAPLKILPLAEEAGLMPSLTARVLDDALAQCARWRADGHDIAVSVNVSASNLLDPGFTNLVISTLARHCVPPETLVLEITETCIISDYERSRQVIEHLKRLGVVMSIDDFGAGFTSLAYLANLAVGELKLDRSFVSGISGRDGERDVELVRSTIALGHALGLRVVAEGIEDPETLAKLGSFGCDVVQGFVISKPMPASDVQLGVLAPI